MSKTYPTNTSDTIGARQLDIFYNTTHMTEDELRIRRLSASRQNMAILKFFQDNPMGYFTPFEWAVMKKDWYRVLKGDGILEVRCPDLEIACRKFIESEYKFHGVVSIHDMIYGSQDVTWQMHHQGFDKPRIRKELEEEGFKILECYNTLPSNDWQLVCRAQK